MARGIRKFTREVVSLQRERAPLALGPLLGELSLHYNMSAGMVADLIDAHEQTVLRWFMGRSNPQPYAIQKIVKLVGILSWMYSEQAPPLTGSGAIKKAAFATYAKTFLDQAKSAA